MSTGERICWLSGLAAGLAAAWCVMMCFGKPMHPPVIYGFAAIWTAAYAVGAIGIACAGGSRR